MIDTDKYSCIRDKLCQEATTLRIRDNKSQREESLIPLGAGGCKRAYSCSGGQRALILPNMAADPLADIASSWEQVVDFEVAMSRRLEKIGLLSLHLEKVTVGVPSSGEASEIVAYEADNFQCLTRRGLYVVDLKNSKSSTWNQKFFTNDADRGDFNKWKRIVDSLVSDIATLVIHRIRIPHDAINFAIQETGKSHCPYQVRYLGFDFSTKGAEKSIAEGEEMSRPNPCQRIRWIANACIDIGKDLVGFESTIDLIATAACYVVFEEEYRTPGSNSFGVILEKEADDLQKRLVTHIKKAVCWKIFTKMIGCE